MHEHIFIPSDKENYEVCQDCGTYHSLAPGNPVELYEVNEYWTYDEHRSKPEEQVLNLQCTDDCGISKVDRVLQFVPKGKTALEIGCFPGVLLKKLMERGYDAYGIEPSPRWIEFICRQAPNATIIKGFFPEVLAPSDDELFDCIVGMDIFEHVSDSDKFMREVHRLLVPGGTAIFMSPIILEDGFMRDRDFKADEHVWIYTKKLLEPYLQSIFSEVKFARWIVAHELVIVKK